MDEEASGEIRVGRPRFTRKFGENDSYRFFPKLILYKDRKGLNPALPHYS